MPKTVKIYQTGGGDGLFPIEGSTIDLAVDSGHIGIFNLLVKGGKPREPVGKRRGFKLYVKKTFDRPFIVNKISGLNSRNPDDGMENLCLVMSRSTYTVELS